MTKTCVVAIQDAMGWKDYHLHEFIVVASKTGRATRIGIPDDEMPDERPCLAGWKIPIARFLTYGTDPLRYPYDFGDDWEHVLEFEELVPTDGGKYLALRSRGRRLSARRRWRDPQVRGIPAGHPQPSSSRT